VSFSDTRATQPAPALRPGPPLDRILDRAFYRAGLIQIEGRMASPKRSQGGEARCPFCMEPVHPEARKCPHCQEYLDPKLAKEKLSPRTSYLAVSSLVVGLLGPFFLFFPGPVAILLALVALARRRESRKGLAVAGLLLGVVWTAALVVLLARGFPGGLHGPSPDEPLF